MIYPFLLYSPAVRHCPIFKNLEGDPYLADLSADSPLLEGRKARDQRGLQAALDAAMADGGHSWGLSPYLERRDTLLADCPQMVAEQRFIHLGLDIIVPLGRILHAPLDAVVEATGYEAGEGNYGGYVLLKHARRRFTPFYSFYGHLCRDRLPEVGQSLPAGEAFAAIGDFHENGNWFHHTHLQVITAEGLAAGYMTKGYCAAHDLVHMNTLCPSSIPLFITARR
jgi:murein DD-endopeptidase MepM/ murein hydrolase activator NlpD